MFNTRQLLGLETSCRLIQKVSDKRIQQALATNLSDLLRYQNMLCRYDKMALKSLDIFSVHGFPVGLIQCESNFIGINGHGSGPVVGSGGWLNIIEKYAKAKEYCSKPFEIDYQGKRKKIIPIPGERIGDSPGRKDRNNGRSIKLFCSDATETDLQPGTLDGVFTDPPYFGNVQYAELMDFCYVWLRKLVGPNESCFKASSTRNRNELTGNENMSRGLPDFTNGLSSVFRKMSTALKKGSPLVFTYHHNDLTAYYPVAAAILDAGLTCSASFPCPAEMGASIHINGTGSSIIDTIFICRSTGKIPRRWVPELPDDLASIISEDLEKLTLGKVGLTRGDIRCIIHGHLIRLAIWNLRGQWGKESATSRKIAAIDGWIKDFGGLPAIEKHLNLDPSGIPSLRTMMIKESGSIYSESQAEISY